jgi:uncharacterized repeat protein (TIGR01451 family)
MVSNKSVIWAMNSCGYDRHVIMAAPFTVTVPVKSMSIANTATPASPGSGMPVHYAIRVTNTGSTTLTSLLIQDTIPAGIDLATVVEGVDIPAAAGGSWNLYGTGTTFRTWELTGLALAPGMSVTATIDAATESCFSGSVVNSAMADGWYAACPTPHATASTTSAPFTLTGGTTSIAVTSTHSPASPGNAAAVTYNLSVRNTGSTTITSLDITDTLPALVAYGGSVYPGGLVFAQAGQVLSWSGAYALGPARTLTITLTGTTSACAVGAVSNTAWAFGSSPCSSGTQAKGIDAGFALAGPLSKLAVSIPALPPATMGQWVEVVGQVANTGTSAANNIYATLYVDPASKATCQGGPLPAGPVTINAGASAKFTWTYSVSGNGVLLFTATATGKDAALGCALDAKGTSTLTAFLPAKLQASAAVSAPSFKQGSVITLTLTLTNTGEASALGVIPLASFLPSDAVTALTGPSPAGPATIAGNGAFTTFTWTYMVQKTGPVTFTVSATGTGQYSGGATGDGMSMPPIVILPSPHLTGTVGVSPASAKPGDTAVLTFTVSNEGAATATAVVPHLWLGNSALAGITGGPTPASAATLAPHESAVFTWNLEARQSGTVVLSVSATGHDGADLTGTLNTSTVLLIEAVVTTPFIAYPNPARGDRLTVAIPLEEPAESVVVDIYDTGLQRVYSGAWKGVATAEGGVTIDGIRKLAPGLYLLKSRVRYRGGREKNFGPIKVMVRR